MKNPSCLVPAFFGFVAFVVLSWLPSPARAEPKPKRYNLISIVTDDQAQWAVGAYGNRECRTPAMDRLAREGARFLNAFCATPVCSPSRASLLTGRYGTQVGITDYIAPFENALGVGLARDAVTWPQVLKTHGYVTGLIGKWHLGTCPEFHPTRRGFDHFFGFSGGGNRPMDPILETEGQEKKYNGPLPDILVNDALEFIERNKDRSFALCLHFRAPHQPYGPVLAEDAAPFEHLDPTVPESRGADMAQVKRWTRDYYASIHSVDRNLVRLLKRLDDLALTANTIVLFTSDHGYMIGHHGLHTKGNAYWIAGGVVGPRRPNMFDLSLRVPLIVRWPGVVKPGMEIREPVSNIDTFASVLGMLGVALPKDYHQEGLDYSPLLRGEKPAWRDAIFGQYDLHNAGLAFMRSIRTEHWHLIRHHFCNGLDELYDLQADPGETNNLYNAPRVRKAQEELQARLTAWERSIRDPLLQRSVPRGIQP